LYNSDSEVDVRTTIMEKKSKSPFVAFSLAEVEELESKFYTVTMGKDFLHDDNNVFAFTEKTALFYRNKAAMGLKKIIKTGDSEDRAEAKAMLCSLAINPLRVQ